MVLIHILDAQTDQILDDIPQKYVPFNVHRQSLKDYQETFEFEALAGESFSQHLAKRNRIIIPGEFGELREFIIYEAIENRITRNIEVYSWASYLEDLKKAKVIKAHKTDPETVQQHVNIALAGTEWTPGNITYAGIRTITFENNTNPLGYLKRVAREFELELDFRVEFENGKIVRYVDLVERLGEYRGREVVLGKDLLSLKRKENTADIVTALWVYGPEREDGTRLEVFVEDEEALQRWGRNGKHLVGEYEPQSTDVNMTIERLTQLGRAELDKRINAIVEYEGGIADLENVPGLEHEQIRFADTIRIKDESYSPALYLEARIHTQERDIFVKSNKKVELGDYVEYTEEEVKALFNQMKAEIRRRLERLVLVSIISSAGSTFKNGIGSTELTARTFLSGNEVDEDGTKYEYRWHKFDKDGNYDAGFYEEGKTITVNASDIDEKASFRVEIILDDEVLTVHEITLTNVFDGEDGEQGPPGPKGEDGKTFYTWIKYADTPTSGMSDNPEGKEYIGIAYNKETPTPSTNYDDYIWAKFKGEQGIPGPPGEDGQPTYTWVKYADDEHGNGMSDSPDGKLYIGLAFNKTTPEESNNPADYTWSLMPQNIEIGGRNLIRNSDFSNGLEHWQSNGSISLVNVDGKEAIKLTGTTNGFYQHPTNLEENTYYTISFKAKSVGETSSLTVGFLNQSRNLRQVINVDSTWKKYTFTTTQFIDFDRNATLHFYANDETAEGVYITETKLEKGNKATDWTPAPEDIQEQIDEAKQEAQQAQTTADGKNSVFHSPTAPSIEGRKIGDVWFDTSRDNLMHRFDGTQWVEAKWGEQSIVANSITANHIKSLVGLNVNDQFIVDSQGNVKFAGNLEGASGTFSGEVVGGSIKSNTTIDVTTDLTVGRNIYLGKSADGEGKRINFHWDGSQRQMYIEAYRYPPDEIGISTLDIVSDSVMTFKAADDGFFRFQGARTFFMPSGDLYFYDASSFNFDGAVSVTGNRPLQIKSGPYDHTFIEFFRDSTDQNTRSAYMGYSSNGTNVFSFNNHLGDFDFHSFVRINRLLNRNYNNVDLVRTYTSGAVDVNAGNGPLRLGYSGTTYVQIHASQIRHEYPDEFYIRPYPGHDIRVADKNGVWRNIRAAGFIESSSRKYKKNIRDYEENALEKILTTPIRWFHFKEESDEEFPHVGVIVEESPAEIVDVKGEGVSSYAMVALSWKAIQQLNQEIKNIKEQLGGIE